MTFEVYHEKNGDYWLRRLTLAVEEYLEWR